MSTLAVNGFGQFLSESHPYSSILALHLLLEDSDVLKDGRCVQTPISVEGSTDVSNLFEEAGEKS